MTEENVEKKLLEPFNLDIRGFIGKDDDFLYPEIDGDAAALSEFFVFMEGYKKKGRNIGISHRISKEYNVWEHDIVEFLIEGKTVRGLMVYESNEACFMCLAPEIPLWLPFSRLFNKDVPGDDYNGPPIPPYDFEGRVIGNLYFNAELLGGFMES